MGKTVDLNHAAPTTPPSAEWSAWRVVPESFAVYWPDISRELDRVPHVWSDHWTKDSIYEAAMSGVFQVWGFGSEGYIRLFVFTQIGVYPAARVLQVVLAFGNGLDQALPIVEATLERFAIEAECPRCEVIGRRGWERKLSRRFKFHRVILSCDVERRRVQ